MISSTLACCDFKRFRSSVFCSEPDYLFRSLINTLHLFLTETNQGQENAPDWGMEDEGCTHIQTESAERGWASRPQPILRTICRCRARKLGGGALDLVVY